MGSPRPLASRWILVLSPPRERPRALSSEPPFCGPWPLADGLARWSNPASGKDSYRPQPDRQTDGSKPPPRPSARITCARSCTCHTAPACPPSASPSAPPKAPHSQTAGYPLPDDPPSRPPRQKRLHSPPLRLRQLIPCRCHTLTATTSTPERK